MFKVKDGDRPFRTTAFAATYETLYNFDFFKGRFVNLPLGSKFPPLSLALDCPSGQCGLVRFRCGLWNDRENDHQGKQARDESRSIRTRRRGAAAHRSSARSPGAAWMGDPAGSGRPGQPDQP